MDKRKGTGTLSMGFSFFTGGMILSFAAIESFAASVAFCMSSEPRFSEFSFERYRSERRFWKKMELPMFAAGTEIDKSKGIFQHIAQMQRWRNLVTHAEPYEIGPLEVLDTVKEPRKLHLQKQHLDYAESANAENARRFYGTACDFVTLVSESTGIDPRATAVYQHSG
jgi:hypothetical protein